MPTTEPPHGLSDTSCESIPHSRRSVRAAANRLELVRAARTQFGTLGYQNTKTTRIAAAAGLTLGALYHHFSGKPELFRTVCDEIQEEVVNAIDRAMSDGAPANPVEGFCDAVAVWVTSYRDPATRQILLVDRATVLGSGYEENHRCIRFVVAALDQTLEDGPVPARATVPLAHLIVSAIDGAGRYIGGAADPDRASQEITVELQRFVRSLAAPTAER